MSESAFSRVTAALDVPMIVVTASDGVRIAGCLVGFSGQSSIDPLHYVVYLSKLNHTYRVARGATHLMVHFLSSDQLDLARHFGELTGDETSPHRSEQVQASLPLSIGRTPGERIRNT